MPKENLDPRDAVIAAPNSHKVLFEDEATRVVEVTIQPGQKEPMHIHAWPSIMIIDASTDINYYNGNGVPTRYGSRQASKEKPFIEKMEPEALHAVENIDPAGTYHAIRIEFKTKK